MLVFFQLLFFLLSLSRDLGSLRVALLADLRQVPRPKLIYPILI